MMELKIAISRIVGAYELELVPGQELKDIFNITIGLRNGASCRVRKRPAGGDEIDRESPNH